MKRIRKGGEEGEEEGDRSKEKRLREEERLKWSPVQPASLVQSKPKPLFVKNVAAYLGRDKEKYPELAPSYDLVLSSIVLVLNHNSPTFWSGFYTSYDQDLIVGSGQGQAAYFLGMAGAMVTVKSLTDENKEYLKARWQAYLAGSNYPDQVYTKGSEIMLEIINSFQTALKADYSDQISELRGT